MEPRMEQNDTTLEQLIEAAQKENWNFVDGHINSSHLAGESIRWSLNTGLYNKDQNVRDLAATLLDRSDEEIKPEDIEKLEKIMVKDSYHVVRYRVVIALYKRGNKSSIVEQIMQEAKDDPDVGELARSYLE